MLLDLQTSYQCTTLNVTFHELHDDDFHQMSRSKKVTGQMFPKTKLLAISLMLFDLQASHLESLYNTLRGFNDSVDSDLNKRSRSYVKVICFKNLKKNAIEEY